MKEVADKLRIYWLAVKYWRQGDSWKKAVEFATALVKNWRCGGY